MSTTKISLANCSEFTILPVDQGQIVEVSYALLPDGCGGGSLVRCTHDRSDGEVSYEVADLDMDADEDDLRFEPWNGILPAHGEWEEATAR